jgi:hypothetical protein
VMNKAMTIRCPECGYENRDMYRFCGMCGATLRQESAPEQVSAERRSTEAPAVTEAEPKAPAAQPPSPQAPYRSLDYLLEDEPPKSRAKLYLTLVLLVLAGGLMIWHWKHDGYPAIGESASPAPSAAPTTASSPAMSAPEAQSPPPPAAPPVKVASAPKPASVQPPATANAAPEAAANEPANAAKNDESAANPESAATPAPAAQADSATETPAPADNAATPDASAAADTKEPAVATPPPAPAPKPKAVPKPVPAGPVLRGDEKLVADGEKYLYGTGVAENCDLAQKNLRTAAGHSNARALTLMGAMYATGHCVARDLPTSYRWFAKALHQDPSNGRVQQDLEILWKQMTPEERQVAVKSGD